ncbi:hypothetical protein MSG28_016229 [Choristoneura fumiferana]|uniref:Uncharacterized protein n=1 Tax=Choristoneura fumiferana TaxID=7141 RepID=A0ACC0K5U0_CHOFU|nr:hypothetical protein MSG28_016229 [Choristoneura fumiferana]
MLLLQDFQPVPVAESSFGKFYTGDSYIVLKIEAHVSKMNNGDCFILDKDHNIFVFVGQKAKGVEKMKAISVANQIRDQDHNGRAEIEIIALGSGDMDSVPSDEEGGDDEVHVSKIPEGVEPTSFKVHFPDWS